MNFRRLIFLFLIPLNTYCQPEGSTPASYKFENISYPNGLSIGYTREIIQDTTGLLWITGGRGVGLHTFDGRNIQTYHKDNATRHFPLNQSIHARKLQDGNLLLSDWGNNLYLFNPYEKIIVDTIQGAGPEDKYEIYDIDIDPSGTIWAITKPYKEGDFIYVLRSENSKKFTVIQKIPVNNYGQIKARDNTIFVTADRSVYLFDAKGTFLKKCDLKDGNKVVSPYGFTIDQNNTLWLKSAHQEEEKARSSALFKYNDTLKEFEIFNQVEETALINTENIVSIGDDMWFMGVHETLWKVNMKNFEVQDYSSNIRGLTDKSFYILNIFKDHSEQLWLTTSMGLIKLGPQRALSYNHVLDSKDGYCTENCYVQSITENDQEMFFSYLYKVVAQNKKTGLTRELDIPLGKIKKGSPQESIWDEGSHKLSLVGDKLIWMDQLYDLNTRECLDVLKDQNDTRTVNGVVNSDKLWIAPYYPRNINELLYVYDLKSGSKKALSPDLEFYLDDFPFKILESKIQNKVWLTTKSQGILSFTKQGKFIERIHEDSSKEYYDLFEDASGTLWISTSTGIGRLKRNISEVEHFNLEIKNYQGRKKIEGIYSIVAIEDKQLWLGGQNGVHRFNLQSLTFDSPNIPGYLKEMECMIAAGRLSENGRIYFGTKNGVVSFDPNTIEKRTNVNNKLPLAFRQITTYNKKAKEEKVVLASVNNIETIVLQPDDIWFSIDFFLPNFENPDKTFYSYKMEGFDSDWSLPSVDNMLKYTNLKPGDYELYIRAGDDPEFLNSIERKLRVEVKEAWYKTSWFYLICILGLVAGVFSLMRYRYERKLQERLAIEKLRTKISSDLHDDVGTILTGISMQSEVLSYTQEGKEKKALTELSHMSRDAIERMRDIVWALDSRKDKYENLLDRMKVFARNNLSNRNISHAFEIGNFKADGFINPNIRQQLYLIFKEAIVNILKHSDANNVTISFDKKQNQLTMTIQDDGSHKPVEKSEGLGLMNMEKRSKDINGKFNMYYENGYIVELIVPI